ncbi:MAG: GGDEF domain-containing protein, partial [Lachnospiraceae bacterium]|nr:GGDEF domain-containing protein [Lachnospiraceae bacterium]
MVFHGNDDHPSILNRMKLDAVTMQKAQDTYSLLTNLFIFCVNAEGERITEMSGDPNDITRILGLVEEHRIESVLRQVLTSSVEEQVVEDTNYSNIKLASIAIRVKGKLAFCWFVCAVLDDVSDKENAVLNIRSTTDYTRFIKSLDLMRELSKKVYENSDMLETAVAESKRSKYSELEMARSLRRSESIADIVQMLDSDESFEDICTTILRETALYTQVSQAYVVRSSAEAEETDILGSYLAEGAQPLDNLLTEKKIQVAGLFGDKPAVVSYKTKINEDMRALMEENHISALVALPIFINRVPAMYAVFVETHPQKCWEMDEVKFFADAVRVLQNILTRRIQKNSLASSFKSLEAILDNVGSAIYVKDMDTEEMLFVNRMFRNTFEQELKNGMVEKLFEANLKYNRGTSYSEVEYMEKSRWYDLHTTVIQWVDGRKVTLCSIFDITDKKLYQRKIEQQANNDFLTGLYNRMSCERDLLSYIDEAKISGKKGAVLYLDLDDFKHINDGLGHQYGDVLLKAISHSLQRIEGVENSCYRMGGDEFVVIIPPTSFERFKQIIEEIQIVFNKPWFLKGADYYCTSSMGIVTFPDEGETVQDLIRKADIAMYDAKKTGKNRTAYYAENSDADSNKRLDM